MSKSLDLILLTFGFTYFIPTGELLIANVLTFQEVYQICQADGCDKENVLRYIFMTVEKRHGANKLQQIVADKNCDLGQFIKDGNFARWLESNVSIERFF